MPKSKHRRKAGGKSVQHPGRSRSHDHSLSVGTSDDIDLPPVTALDGILRRYFDAYLGPFHQQAHPECEYADELLDLVSDATFDPATPAFHSANKAYLLQTFTSRTGIKDGREVSWTPEEAETALRYLVEKEMVVVDGDVVSTHPRFAYLVGASGDSPAPSHDDADAPSEIR
jgi:hypothetical protein